MKLEKLIDSLKENNRITIKGENYVVRTKTYYSIEEDKNTSYIKCELDKNKVLVVIPEDSLIYIGEVIENMKYNRISENSLIYKNIVYEKTGEGHQFITNIEFGSKDEVEGRCIFEDYESEYNIISLGILTDKDNKRADVYADILDINDIMI